MEDRLKWSLEAERDKKIYALIDDNNLPQKSGKTRDELYAAIKKVTSLNHLAFVLADAANSILIDCDQEMSKVGVFFTHKNKQNFNQMLNHIRSAIVWSKKTISPIYDEKDNDDVDGSCNDSDWYYNCIKLIEEKIAGDEKKTDDFLHYLLSIEGGKGLYKIKYDNFKF